MDTTVRIPPDSPTNVAAPRAQRHSLGYSMPPHVYACRLASGTVVIDLKRNRYVGVSAAIGTLLASYLSGNSESVSTSSQAPIDSLKPLASLMDAGLLQPTGPDTRPFDPSRIDLYAPLLAIDETLRVATRIRWREVVRFYRHNAMTRLDLRSRSLYSIASELHCAKQRQRQQSAAGHDLELASLVLQFRRLRPYAFAAHDQCLFHALTLTRFLGGHGVYPTWVIGVRLRPWGAHSWVQHDHWLLDATPEAVREYTPILAV